jgi:endonuclease/exonuclease/phosphatase family metal-dependent hydrolase
VAYQPVRYERIAREKCMPPFPKPSFNYEYDVAAQITALREWRDTQPGRAVPDKAANRLLLATWNVANLGVQDRRDQDYRLIAEILAWFDIIALEEVNDNLTGLRGIQGHLPSTFKLLFSDPAGNKERLAFIYDSAKLTLLEKVGEIAIPPADLRYVKLPGIEQKFDGFDRNPYFAAFEAEGLRFLLVGVHLFYGSESAIDMNRRSLETYGVARWTDVRRKSNLAYTHNIVALGDFNLPKVVPGDPIYDALTGRGLVLPGHSTQMGSSIASDNHYDQIGFFPGPIQDQFKSLGVFDFDGAVFKTLWQTHTDNNHADFFAYVRYYLSDHRPMWAEFEI